MWFYHFKNYGKTNQNNPFHYTLSLPSRYAIQFLSAGEVVGIGRFCFAGIYGQ